MAVSRDYLGRTSPPTKPYEVSRTKIAEYVAATGDDNPAFRDRDAARAAGHRDVMAPPTFPIVIIMATRAPAGTGPDIGINYAMVVHTAQRFVYSRPIYAGDVITCQSTVTDIRESIRNVLITTETQIVTVGGEHICTEYSTFLARVRPGPGILP